MSRPDTDLPDADEPQTVNTESHSDNNGIPTSNQELKSELVWTSRLKQECDMLKAVLDNSQSCMAYLDTDLFFRWANAACSHFSGISCEALVGCNLFDVFPDLDRQASFARSLQNGEPVQLKARPSEHTSESSPGCDLLGLVVGTR